MNELRKYIYLGAVLLIGVLTAWLVITVKEKKVIEKKLEDATENVKSYSSLFSDSQNKNRAFKLTIEQLEHSNDSIFRELDSARKELKIKDSKIKSLMYISSDFSRVDTIKIKGDTIFRDSNIKIDTLIHDNWYSLRVGVEYPSTITVKPEFKSVKNVIISTKKETVNPPKKFFLFRWFQKKHTIVNVDIVEKNPYIQNQNNRYVEVLGN